MLSMPLAHPSTLDHRDRVAQTTVTASYVEEFWSPALLRSHKNRTLRQRHYFSFDFRARAQRAFLSRTGPHSRSALVQAEHLPFIRSRLTPETTRATRWVALA
jgi:hypothetical protein